MYISGLTNFMNSSNHLTFYFSFRSPYAWLAFYRLSKIALILPVTIDYIPLFPPKPVSGDSNGNPNKSVYVTEDINRFANAYGLDLQWPNPFDTDWKRPHSSFLYALDQGRAIEFGLAAFKARFSAGKDIGQDDTLAGIAEQSGLQTDSIIESADNSLFQRRVMKGAIRGQREGIFGVPFFIYRGSHYWGNDRLEWLLRDIFTQSEIEAPNLIDDAFASPLKI
jgi:2-hydroxychromene-2-carboxylate isomerase